jgi:hypothetical protein
VGQFGYAAVYDALQACMTEDFSFLQTVCAPKAKAVTATPPQPAPQPPTQPPPPTALQPSTPAKQSKNPTIVVKKEGKRGRKPKATIAAPSPLENETVQLAEPTVTVPTEAEQGEKKFRDAKEVKQWQRDQEAKKRAELDAKGISADSLLTKENLKQWIEVEGRTYADVARTYVGCQDTQVSAAAKLYGIQSANSMKRISMLQKK